MATEIENTFIQRAGVIKNEACEYIRVKKTSPDTDTHPLENKVHELIDGGGPTEGSMVSLIVDSIQSRPANKSQKDRERLKSHEEHKFKMVGAVTDLHAKITKCAEKYGFVIDQDPLLKYILETANHLCITYPEKLRNRYEIEAVSPNSDRISQAASTMPENGELSPTNQVKDSVCHCELGDLSCPH